MECPPKKVADSGGRVYVGFNETGETFSSSAVFFLVFVLPCNCHRTSAALPNQSLLSW